MAMAMAMAMALALAMAMAMANKIKRINKYETKNYTVHAWI